METKTCVKCKVEKELTTNFLKCKTKNTYRAWCIKCSDEHRVKERRHPDSTKVYNVNKI